MLQEWNYEEEFSGKKIFLEEDALFTLKRLANSQVFTSVPNSPNQEAIYQLLDQGKINAWHFLERQKATYKFDLFSKNNLLQALKQLQIQLDLPKLPRRIECLDISHLSGKHVYGAIVVFIDGQPCPRLYKLFRCPEQNNDYENQAMVLRRRLKRFLDQQTQNTNVSEEEKFAEKPKRSTQSEREQLNEWSLPDLIIIDGGKGQLTTCWQVLQELQLSDRIAIAAFAKKNQEFFTVVCPKA